MRRSNSPLRLSPSLADEGVSVNTYVNVAVRQTAAEFCADRAKGGSPGRALEILEMAGREAGPEPEPSDEVLEA